jgi:hypothetical protein
MDDLNVVLTAREADGLEWSIFAGPDTTNPDSFWTFIRRGRPGGPSAQSGMGGPKLHGGPINTWSGQADGTPPFVMVRAAPNVERIFVTTRSGRGIDLTMSEVIDDFQLRFGAAALPEGDSPGAITMQLADGESVTWPFSWTWPDPSPRTHHY